jgi:hypothetical protein
MDVQHQVQNPSSPTLGKPMEEDDNYLSLRLQSSHPVIQEQLHETTASRSAPQHLSNTYNNHNTCPLPENWQPKDIYSFEIVRATIASQEQEDRNDAAANRPVDIVKSSTEQYPGETEDSTGTPLSEAIRPTSISPSSVTHQSEYEGMTRKVKNPIPSMESKQPSRGEVVEEQTNVVDEGLKGRAANLSISADGNLILSQKTELLSPTDITYLNLGVRTMDTMESAIPTLQPLPPQPQLEFHRWSGQVLPLAAGSCMPPLHTTEGRSLYLRWNSNHVTDRPVIGKVYYIPDGRNFPTSVIHMQKQQEGFFKHPVLVIGVEDSFAYFYALTKAPPVAIREMSMCLRVSESTVDEGLYTLRLADGSPRMQTETWMNLEQRFYIEVSSICTKCT